MAVLGMPTSVVVLARVVGGALVFFVLARLGGTIRIEGRDVPRLVLCAILGVVANQVLFLHGLERTTATNATVLVTTIPVFTLLFAVLFRIERLRAGRLAGILLGLGGTLVLVEVDRFSLADEHVVGNLMVVANSGSYGLFLVMVRKLAVKIRPMALVTLIFAAAVPFVALPGALSFLEIAPTMTLADVGLLAFIVAVPTVAAYGLNQKAIEHADPSLVASYIYLQPIFGTAGAVVLLGERPGWRVAAAAVLIFAGVYLSTRSERRAHTATRARRSPVHED